MILRPERAGAVHIQTFPKKNSPPIPFNLFALRATALIQCHIIILNISP